MNRAKAAESRLSSQIRALNIRDEQNNQKLEDVEAKLRTAEKKVAINEIALENVSKEANAEVEKEIALAEILFEARKQNTPADAEESPDEEEEGEQEDEETSTETTKTLVSRAATPATPPTSTPPALPSNSLPSNPTRPEQSRLKRSKSNTLSQILTRSTMLGLCRTTQAATSESSISFRSNLTTSTRFKTPTFRTIGLLPLRHSMIQAMDKSCSSCRRGDRRESYPSRPSLRFRGGGGGVGYEGVICLMQESVRNWHIPHSTVSWM
jgi:hypothetical protein